MSPWEYMIDFQTFTQVSGLVLDFFGIIVILFGAFLATVAMVVTYIKGSALQDLYNHYRWNLARSILVGLEFLVAGDIIRSVGGQLSLEAVGILAVIVLVMAFLGIEFQMEIDGHWPWKRPVSRKDDR